MTTRFSRTAAPGTGRLGRFAPVRNVRNRRATIPGAGRDRRFGRARAILLGCGVASSVLYAATDVLAGLRYDGYSFKSQAVSELSAAGAATRPLVVGLFTPYNALVIAFGAGVWMPSGRRRAGRLTGALLIASAAVGQTTLLLFPMDQRGAAVTSRGSMHPALTGVMSLCIVLAMVLAARLLGRRFHVYSIATILTLLVFGGLAGLDAPRLEAGEPRLGSASWSGSTSTPTCCGSRSSPLRCCGDRDHWRGGRERCPGAIALAGVVCERWVSGFSSRAHAALTARRDGCARPSTKGADMRRMSLIAGLALVAGLAGAATAAAEERTCRGTLGAITVDNLRVPQGATCTLNGTRVQGTVKVERDATLRATGIRVIGNVQAENHRSVTVAGSSTVGGSIQLVQGGTADLVGNRVTGDIQLFANRGAQSVTRNRVNGNLQCKENVPAPTGGGNIVQGNKEDQCARR
jgi:hypothetical protein